MLFRSQWEVIERLVAEFAAGEGARGPLQRTIFAVGDEKQSIFSFQGALPAAFGQKRRGFERAYGVSCAQMVARLNADWRERSTQIF